VEKHRGKTPWKNTVVINSVDIEPVERTRGKNPWKEPVEKPRKDGSDPVTRPSTGQVSPISVTGPGFDFHEFVEMGS